MKRAMEMEDERFAAAPRFRPRLPRKEAMVALDLDSRFTTPMPMFDSCKAPVDKRGRRRKNREEEGDEEDKEKKDGLIRQEDGHQLEEDEDEQESSTSSDGEEEDDDDRGQYSLRSDIAHYLTARHDDTPTIDKETCRLAVVNMDWNHIKAVDLYMVMTSCIPKGGRVLSVSIYPTEFGLKCMNIETTQGPSALIGADGDGHDDGGEDDNNDDDEEDSDIDSETENNKLRTYELNRLRYYHAVVVCDSSATADHLYTTLDGTEFLKTANVFDLQFIPDSKEFKYPARDVATEAPPSYKEPDFETHALQHSKVKITWDDDEPERKILKQKFKNQFDGYDKFLPSDGSESEHDVDDSGDENGVAKRKLTNKERWALLLPQGNKSDEERSDDEDMEITFDPKLEDLGKRIHDRKSIETKTVWEMHQEKMKEKRKAKKRPSKDDDEYSEEDSVDDFFDDEKSHGEVKPVKKQKVKAKPREELELLVAAGQDAINGAKGYDIIKRKSKKGKKGKDSVEDKLAEIVDLSKDERFSPMFTSHLYALDPTDPQYKRMVRKQAGKKGALYSEPPVEPPDDASPKKANRKHEMQSAINSLKRKLSALKNASKSER